MTLRGVNIGWCVWWKIRSFVVKIQICKIWRGGFVRIILICLRLRFNNVIKDIFNLIRVFKKRSVNIRYGMKARGNITYHIRRRRYCDIYPYRDENLHQYIWIKRWDLSIRKGWKEELCAASESRVTCKNQRWKNTSPLMYYRCSRSILLWVWQNEER